MRTQTAGPEFTAGGRQGMHGLIESVRNWARENRAAVLLAILYLMVATAYNLADPLFEPPDELLHWNFVQTLRQERRLPVVDLAGPQTEDHQPPLYYATVALFALPEDDLAAHTLRNPFWGYDIGLVGRDNKNQYLHDPDLGPLADATTRSVRATRAMSTLYGCLTVLLSYALARQFVPRPVALASMAVVAFTPNFLLTTTAVTNDSLAILISVAAGLASVSLVGRDREPTLRAWIGLGILLGVGLVTKVNAWPLLPTAVLAATLLAVRLRSRRVFWVAGATVAILATLLGGWWVVRNIVLYGDLTGMSSMWAVWGVRAPLTWGSFAAWLASLRVSFWANFGYGNITLPGYVYKVIDALVVGGAAGLLWALVRRRGLPPQPAQRHRTAVLLFWVILTFGGLVWYLQRTPAVTGRQLFSILPVIALGLCSGWGQWFPAKWRQGLSALIVTGMVVLGIGAWACALVPAYRPAPRLLPAQADQAIGHRLDWKIGDVASLLGYDISPDAVRGGGQAEVTLYWLPLKQPDRNYTVFVHLFGVDRERVGERNTYPGLGTFPTIYWSPGEVVVDTIPVPIAERASGPVLLDVEVGLYDAQTMQRLTATDPAGHTVESPVIGKLKLLAAGRAGEPPSHPLEQVFGGGLELSGYDLSSTMPEAGSTVTLTLYWSPSGPLDRDYTVFVHLVDRDGTISAQADGPPYNGRYPTTAWAAGERLRDLHPLSLPLNLEPGEYHLQVGLYDGNTMARLGLVDGTDAVPLESTILVR